MLRYTYTVVHVIQVLRYYLYDLWAANIRLCSTYTLSTFLPLSLVVAQNGEITFTVFHLFHGLAISKGTDGRECRREEKSEW
jgi:hypothetical protein